MEVIYRCFNSKRKFGIELEVEKNRTQEQIHEVIQTVSKKAIQTSGGGWAQSTNNDYWHVKYDSTCGPKGKGKDNGGWEVASFVASGYKDLLEVESVTDALQESGCQVNNNCGLHIHADVSDLSKDQISVLTACWIKVETWLSQAVPSNRVNNKYCKLITKVKVKNLKFENSYEPVKLWDIVKPTNFSTHENDEKKMSLNLVGVALKFHYIDQGAPVPIGVRQTIELRMPEGTLNGNEVKNWVRMFLLFVETCKDAKMPSNLKPVSSIEELLYILGMAHPEKFYLLSKGLHETKTWLLKRVKNYGTHKGKRAATDKLKFIST